MKERSAKASDSGTDQIRHIRDLNELRTALDQALALTDDAVKTEMLVQLLSLPASVQVGPRDLPDILSYIGRSPAPDELRHKLVVTWAKAGKSPPLVGGVVRSICQGDRNRLNFPVLRQGDEDTRPYIERVREWIGGLRLEVPASDRTRQHPDVPQILSAWRCLAPDRDLDYYEPSVMSLVLRCCDLFRSDFRKEAVRLYASEAAVTSGLARLSGVTSTLQVAAEQAREMVARARRDQERAAVRLDQTERELAEVRAELRRVQAERDELQGHLQAERKSSEKAAARAEAEAARLQEVARAERVRLLHGIRRDLDREITELRLCLDRAEPNVAMAVNRVRNLEEMSRELGK